MQIEKAVAQPALQRHHPESITTQLLALEVGQSWAKVERLPATTTGPEITEAKARLKNNMGKAVARVREAAPERAIVISQGDYRTAEWDTIICYTITRTA